ncbi:M20 family metallopeptidase [Jiangella muralis]|uniref:M20 family metallopeptidase n=1 Tax=Jiangella muralis TaxID=702383 RepID=UPI0012F95003|nr:M20/M25/M40 family metallo-hydrolase [Jiangella muralis]
MGREPGRAQVMVTAAALPGPADVIELARDLIRLDTSRANETAAAELLSDYLGSHGVSCELVARDPARANLVAHLAGGDGDSLAFVGHTDVVPASPEGWTYPPFEAVVDPDGFLHGRGALDMLGELAARAVAMAAIARSGTELSGDLWLLAVADEEDGSADVGMRWLLETRPDVRPTYSVNEGGGERHVDRAGRTVALLDIGEKGSFPVRITARGEAGHASMPTLGRNAVTMLARLVQRLGDHTPEPSAPSPLVDLAPSSPILAHRARALAGSTLAPTRLRGSAAINVMPARASVDVDCRVLPGTTGAQLLAELDAVLGDDLPWDVEALTPWVPGSSSPPGGRFVEAVRRSLVECGDPVDVLPTLITGFSDSVHLRQVGTHAYGFTILRHTSAERVLTGLHNVDESIHTADLLEASRWHQSLARHLLVPA